jgi:putative hydroxymethylpyrimidine transport system permease protein
MRTLRPLFIAFALLALWELGVRLGDIPHYILPPPSRVFAALADNTGLLLANAGVTLLEIVLGLLLGTVLGCLSGLALAHFAAARGYLLPVLIVSQAIPVFALAPMLVLWLGFGLASKIAMAALVIYFPIASAFYDGLRRTEPGWLELARTMSASPRAILLQISLPAALPAFASGLRVAAAVAPIGAVIGEWVGAAAGLGYLMTLSMGRGQTDLAFAALFLLALMGLAVFYAIDAGLRRLIPWQRESAALSDRGD